PPLRGTPPVAQGEARTPSPARSAGEVARRAGGVRPFRTPTSLTPSPPAGVLPLLHRGRLESRRAGGARGPDSDARSLLFASIFLAPAGPNLKLYQATSRR